jgi:hypothetical protein
VGSLSNWCEFRGALAGSVYNSSEVKLVGCSAQYNSFSFLFDAGPV